MIEVPLGKIGIPFLLAGMNGKEINKTRMMEAVITAIVSGGVIAMAGYYVAFPVLQEQVLQMRRESQDTRDLIKEIRVELEARALRQEAKEAALEAKIVQLQIELAKRRN